jgi:hypothetical protein
MPTGSRATAFTRTRNALIADRREAYAEAIRELSLAQLETTKAKPEQVQGKPLLSKFGIEWLML